MGGPFDKRYDDVFVPAIRAAGLEPYRVDCDPAVVIPIEDIEEGIRRADLCLADISLPNPNVWFEVGFSIAAAKPVVLVCSMIPAEDSPSIFSIERSSCTEPTPQVTSQGWVSRSLSG